MLLQGKQRMTTIHKEALLKRKNNKNNKYNQ